MTSVTWHSAIAERCKHLAGLGKLPPPLARDPALRAIAAVSLFADADIHHALTPSSTAPQLTTPGYVGRNGLAADLLAQLTQTVAAPCRGRQSQTVFSPSAWLADHGLDALVLRSVKHSADDAGRGELLAHAAHQARNLIARFERLGEQHATDLITRDAPALLSELRHRLRCAPLSILGWILAHEHDGDPSRAARVVRRLQAFQLYASLIDRLREPAMTAVIDDGRELVPALAGRLALTRAQLCALREAMAATAAESHLASTCEYEAAARHLQAHAVPLHQWPGGGRPAQHEAWDSSPWLEHCELTLIRADYYGGDQTVRDAVNSFEEDLLKPLMAELDPARVVGPGRSNHKSLYDLGTLLRPANFSPELLGPIQSFLSCVRHALVGPRGPKAFEKAARLWHRRAASAAALRNENQSDRPGWPALCPPWTSPCGRFEIVPLTTAQALVDEGNAHQHCVGSYYAACRSGDTQILSLRVRGVPAVTAEILLDRGLSSLRVGQFKGWHDQVPDDPTLHQAMRNFLRDLRRGAHPLNLRELHAYRQWAAEHFETWSVRAPTIAQARATFPLYLPLLPRGTPPDFDRWCDATGLRDGLAAALRDLTAATVTQAGAAGVSAQRGG